MKPRAGPKGGKGPRLEGFAPSGQPRLHPRRSPFIIEGANDKEMNAMKARIKWVQDRTFLGESGSGHSVVMDGSPEAGGRNLGVRPMEMLLLGLGGCTAFDIVDILQKSRQPVEDCVVEVTGERTDTVPKVFTRIEIDYLVSGQGLSRAKVERAVTLSAEKYCSIAAMLSKTAEINHHIKIIDTSPR